MVLNRTFIFIPALFSYLIQSVVFDDLKGLLIDPIFVLAEITFELGYRPNLEKEVTAQAVQLRRQLNATTKQTA